MKPQAAFRLLVCAGLLLGGSRMAAASAIHVLIDDSGLAPLGAEFRSGSGTIDVSVLPPFTVVQPGVGQFGEVENHFEYLSGAPGLLPGQSVTKSYNLFADELLTTLDDILTVTVTAHEPTPGNNTNLTVDLLFRSTSLDGIAPAALPGAIDLFELQDLERIFSRPYLRLGGPPGDFEVDIAPDRIPEPGTIALLGLGAAAVLRRRVSRSRRCVPGAAR